VALLCALRALVDIKLPIREASALLSLQDKSPATVIPDVAVSVRASSADIRNREDIKETTSSPSCFHRFSGLFSNYHRSSAPAILFLKITRTLIAEISSRERGSFLSSRLSLESF